MACQVNGACTAPAIVYRFLSWTHMDHTLTSYRKSIIRDHTPPSHCLSRQWDGNPLGLGLVAEDKPSEFSWIHSWIVDFLICSIASTIYK